MSETISIQQAAGRLPELVRALGPNDEIVLTDNEIPVAKIMPSPPPKSRTPGLCKGMLTIVSDDEGDAEIAEMFKDYMP